MLRQRLVDPAEIAVQHLAQLFAFEAEQPVFQRVGIDDSPAIALPGADDRNGKIEEAPDIRYNAHRFLRPEVGTIAAWSRGFRLGCQDLSQDFFGCLQALQRPVNGIERCLLAIGNLRQHQPELFLLMRR